MQVTEIKLELGDLVKLRNGNVYIVMPDDCSSTGLSLYRANDNYYCHEHTTKYYSNLKHHHSSQSDIMAVFKSSKSKNNFSKLESTNAYIRAFYRGELNFTHIKWDWEREEVKEMTVADIEKLVGTKVKIVKEA